MELKVIIGWLLVHLSFVEAMLKTSLNIQLPEEISNGELCAIDISLLKILKLECDQDIWYGTLQNNVKDTKLTHLKHNSENQKFEFVEFWDKGISFKDGEKLVLMLNEGQISIKLP